VLEELKGKMGWAVDSEIGQEEVTCHVQHEKDKGGKQF
jgi:hypothetical protein